MRSLSCFTIALSFAAGLTLAANVARCATPKRDFRPRRVVKPFPPLVNPKTLPAARVRDEVRDDELVLGVVVGNQARAYPINMLTRPTREIINDRVGNRAIAATW